MRSLLPLVLFFLVLGFVAGCSSVSPKITATNITYFHYQLQNAQFEKLKELGVGLLVVDPDDARLTREQINHLNVKGVIVLAYLSIGEAEDYRDYWKGDWREGNPSFIDKENPEWKGNYKVYYWREEWGDIILKRVEWIVEQGYDGVYLDIIDAYYYYQEGGREGAAQEMIDFVVDISRKGNALAPGFLIVPQNSPELYADDVYKNAIDGLGKEDTWFIGDELKNVKDQAYELQFLVRALNDGKFVLAIDYPTTRENICEFYYRCKRNGFFCMAGNRELNLDEGLVCRG